MANTFLHAKGYPMGKSLHEADMKEQTQEIMTLAEQYGCQILLPRDGQMATDFATGAPHTQKAANTIDENEMMLDLGPNAVHDIKNALSTAKTVLWNGPLGAFEIKPFDAATTDVARQVAQLTENGSLVSVAGGGDTVAALDNAGVLDKFSYVSTAGGAFLEWLEGKDLPGVAALQNQCQAA